MSYEIFGKDMTELRVDEKNKVKKNDVSKNESLADNVEPVDNYGRLEGKNAVMEAIKAGRTIDKIYILDGMRDSTVSRIISKLKGTGTSISFVKKQRLDSMSETGHHQGIIAQTASYDYADMDDIFELAKKRGEPPFIIILDEIEDPHNLGAIIRTANICGAHGVVIPKHHATGITATVVKASAGAINFTPVVKVTNIVKTIEELKGRGLWFACADMGGEPMYTCNLTGAIGLVIGNEGSGVSRLVKEKCDYIVSIPMKGDIESLNASVATGILAYEIVRQRSIIK